MGQELSLQERFAPQNACFGCGPANEKGLRIRSFVNQQSVVATWQAQPHHEAFPGVLNGGIIGALLDCHSNWAAAYFLMDANQDKVPPCTVTAEYHVKLRKPTPSEAVIELEASLKEIQGAKAWIEATLSADGVVTASCDGLFVAVKPGHPAFHRWAE